MIRASPSTRSFVGEGARRAAHALATGCVRAGVDRLVLRGPRGTRPVIWRGADAAQRLSFSRSSSSHDFYWGDPTTSVVEHAAGHRRTFSSLRSAQFLTGCPEAYVVTKRRSRPRQRVWSRSRGAEDDVQNNKNPHPVHGRNRRNGPVGFTGRRSALRYDVGRGGWRAAGRESFRGSAVAGSRSCRRQAGEGGDVGTAPDYTVRQAGTGGRRCGLGAGRRAHIEENQAEPSGGTRLWKMASCAVLPPADPGLTGGGRAEVGGHRPPPRPAGVGLMLMAPLSLVLKWAGAGDQRHNPPRIWEGFLRCRSRGARQFRGPAAGAFAGWSPRTIPAGVRTTRCGVLATVGCAATGMLIPNGHPAARTLTVAPIPWDWGCAPGRWAQAAVVARVMLSACCRRCRSGLAALRRSGSRSFEHVFRPGGPGTSAEILGGKRSPSLPPAGFALLLGAARWPTLLVSNQQPRQAGARSAGPAARRRFRAC